VVVPLALGWASGHVPFGAYAALGAFSAGIASFQDESRTRVAGVVLASIGMALSAFIGATKAATSGWLLVPIVAIWGYFTGLAVALGPRWSLVVLQWSIALRSRSDCPSSRRQRARAHCSCLPVGSSKPSSSLLRGRFAQDRANGRRSLIHIECSRPTRRCWQLESSQRHRPPPFRRAALY
jgi:hypothetical protein